MSDAVVPIPRRFRWLKRLSIAGVVLLVLMLSLRLGWGWYEQHRLDALVNAIAARGEPIHLADMKVPHVVDADNAVYYYEQALAQWPKVNGQLISATQWYDDPQNNPDPITDNAAYLQQCTPVFALLRKGAMAPGWDWHVAINHPTVFTPSPNWRPMWQLMKQINDAAWRAHVVGDDRLALQLQDNGLSLADSINGPQTSLLPVLVGMTIRRDVGQYGVERIAPTLRVSTESLHAASPQQVRALIAHLLEENVSRKQLVHAYIGQRWSTYDTYKQIVSGKLALSALQGGMYTWRSPQAHVGQWPYQPVVVADACYMIAALSRDVNAARNATTVTEFDRIAQAKEIDLPSTYTDKYRWLHPLSMILLPAIDAAGQTYFNRVAVTRMAAIALAIRLYQTDHGHRPATLAELVPAYLPAVPRDPLAVGDKPIRYLPQGVVPDTSALSPQQRQQIAGRRVAVLYSVGRDGKDDGGKCAYDSDGTVYADWSSSSQCDAVFVLDPQP